MFAAIVGPVVSPYDPTTQALEARLQSPSLAHPLGTDALGRDVATRLVYGARISLALAVVATGLRLVIGTTIGLVAATGGRLVDAVLMRLVDVQLAFPGLVLALVIAGVLGPSLRNVVLALSLVGWASYARIVRGSVLSVKRRPYVQSAKLYGTLAASRPPSPSPDGGKSGRRPRDVEPGNRRARGGWTLVSGTRRTATDG